MRAKGSVSVDLVAVYVQGVDAFGKPFDVALDQETASSLIFKLHRMVLEQQRMRDAVNAVSGGKAA